MEDRIGTVAGLWRYPVKSVQGETLARLAFDERGASGDRLYALYDAEGKLGSGKTTGTFTKMDGLLGMQAAYRAGRPVIRLSDGRELLLGEPGTDEALTRVLGLPVTVSREEELSHMDEGAVHLITTAGLRALRQAMPGAEIDERRFRPNLVIDIPGEEPPEQSWIGRQLRAGEAIFRLTGTTERCEMVTAAQSGLPADRRILRHVARTYGANFGVYASVLRSGSVSVGDAVYLLRDEDGGRGL